MFNREKKCFVGYYLFVPFLMLSASTLELSFASVKENSKNKENSKYKEQFKKASFCGGAIVPDDMPFRIEAKSVSSHQSKSVVLKKASQDKIHVIDIAFIYSSLISNRKQLKKNVRASVLKANVIFVRSNVNAKLRVVAIQPDHKYNISINRNLALASSQMIDILPAVRSEYGADLVYAVSAEKDPRACARAYLRVKGTSKAYAAEELAAGGIWNGFDDEGCLGDNFILAHEVGHNLGLKHTERDRYTGFVSFGQGYYGMNKDNKDYGTVMAGKGYLFHRFSTNLAYKGVKVGSSEANASEALLYTIEEASNYAETKVKDSVFDYECSESEYNVCLQSARFHVEVQVFYKNSSGDQVSQKARVKKALLNSTNKTSSLFYFFSESNPELLVKVIDGCDVNGKYWVFGSAGTDLDYSVFVTDNATGIRRPYHRNSTNPLINDASAFPCSVSR